MAVTHNTEASGRIREGNIADRLTFAPFLLIAAIPLAITFMELLGFKVAAAVPLWSKWTWLAAAFLSDFFLCRNLGAGSRKPEKTLLPKEFERAVQRGLNFFATVCAGAMTFLLGIGSITMAPQSMQMVAGPLFAACMLAGLICGDKFGYFHLRLKRTTVVF